MAKPLFVLVDTNSQYIAHLEARLLETFRDSIELEVIDDLDYLEKFNSSPRRIDVLIAAERLCAAFQRQNDIGIIYKLTEEPSDENLQGLSVRSIYKYSHIQKVFGEIEYGARQFVQIARVHAQKTKIVLVYSAAGGMGKTTVALGLSANLANNHKKVLYLDVENIQDFGYYLQDKSPMATAAERYLGSATADLYSEMKPYIRREGFDYMPPLRMAASAMGIDCSVYGEIAQSFRKHVDYDYIILDTDTDFDEQKDKLMQMADKVILLTGVSEFVQYKTSLMMQNFASTDSGKFLVVCNHPGPSFGAGVNESGDASVGNMAGPVTLAAMQKNRDLEKLSYLI